MKRILQGLFLSIVLGAGHAGAATGIGTVIALEGTATATSPAKGTRPLELKSDIFLNDTVATGPRAKLQIMLKDETVISQGAASKMTIDEYVYSPEKAEENATSLSIFQGLFRVITGKITKLNPNRFRVRTSMATIGIRGCDVGFNVTDQKQDFYVIFLHGTESVMIRGLGDMRGRMVENSLGGAAPRALRQRLINIRKANRMVSINVAGQMRQRKIDPRDLTRLLHAVMPKVTGRAPSPGPSRPGGSPTGPDSHAAIRKQPTEPSSALPTHTGSVSEPIPDPDPIPDPIPAPSAPEQPDRPSVVVGGTGRTDRRDTPSTSTDPQQPPTPPTTPAPETVYTRKGGGADWEWGIWATDGVIDRVDFKALTPIAPADFQAISAGTALYDLQGSGAAAATISRGTARSLVEGGCTLFVQVGQGVTPNWDGSFSMQNPSGDALDFEAIGLIQPDGKISGSRTAYSMQVHGQTFDGSSIVNQSISGTLVGPGTATGPVTGSPVGSGSATRPITGAVGHFSFDHGMVQVNGGFGSDLSPVPVQTAQ